MKWSDPGGLGISLSCKEERCPGISGPGHANDSMGAPPPPRQGAPLAARSFPNSSERPLEVGGLEAAGGHIHSGMEFRFDISK